MKTWTQSDQDKLQKKHESWFKKITRTSGINDLKRTTIGFQEMVKKSIKPKLREEL